MVLPLGIIRPFCCFLITLCCCSLNAQQESVLSEQQCVQVDEYIESIAREYPDLYDGNVEKYLADHSIDIESFQRDDVINSLIYRDEYALQERIEKNNKPVFSWDPLGLGYDNFGLAITQGMVYQLGLIGIDAVLDHRLYGSIIHQLAETVVDLCKEKKRSLELACLSSKNEKNDDIPLDDIPLGDQLYEIMFDQSAYSLCKRLARPLFYAYFKDIVLKGIVESVRMYQGLYGLQGLEFLLRGDFDSENTSSLRMITFSGALDFLELYMGRLHGVKQTDLLNPDWASSWWLLTIRRIVFSFLFLHKSLDTFFLPYMRVWVDQHSELLKLFVQGGMSAEDKKVVIESCDIFLKDLFSSWLKEKSRTFFSWKLTTHGLIFAMKMIPWGYKIFRYIKQIS